MSEPAPAPEVAAKKKSKLPVILALVAVLGGGGFFVMKSKGGKKVKPAVKLGPISDIKDEFLVNLRDTSGNYLRVAVSLQFADGTKAEEVEKSMSSIQDIINMRLRSKSLGEVRSLDGTRALKRQIATDINAVLKEGEKKEEEAPKSDVPPKIPEGWDSADGPVLKVLFRSFAWQ
jgi:flagellar basal body-associated protein FliL